MGADNWTIYAPASALGRGGVTVFRVSGPACRDIFLRLTGRRAEVPRFAYYVELSDPVDGDSIDDALAIFFPSPKSFTGEDVVEFHIHGSPAVAHKLAEVLSSFPGVRLAEAGEFTRRAFENGKLDLTRAEGLADLVDAQTEAQRKQALRQSRGGLAEIYHRWHERLLHKRVEAEALIDFSDQEDVAQSLDSPSREDLREIAEEIRSHLNDGRRGERLREGVHLAIVGPPNAGKSSLLNMLSNRDVAIVSAVAGTTRDVIETRLDIGGYPVVVADTAGIRESMDEIEKEGVRRAWTRAQEADLCLVVYDASDLDTRPWAHPFMGNGIPENEGGDDAKNTVQQKTGLNAQAEKTTPIVVFNKKDRASDFLPPADMAGDVVCISLKTGEGVDSFLSLLKDRVRALCENLGDPGITRSRHREHLQNTYNSLCRALETEEMDLYAEDVRAALDSLGRITGRVGVEDVLDVVFRDFCIGK